MDLSGAIRFRYQRGIDCLLQRFTVVLYGYLAFLKARRANVWPSAFLCGRIGHNRPLFTEIKHEGREPFGARPVVQRLY